MSGLYEKIHFLFSSIFSNNTCSSNAKNTFIITPRIKLLSIAALSTCATLKCAWALKNDHFGHKPPEYLQKMFPHFSDAYFIYNMFLHTMTVLGMVICGHIAAFTTIAFLLNTS